MRGFRACAALVLAPLLLPAQDLKEFAKRVTGFTLANGLRFIVAERHASPIVSFHTYVRAGSVDDPQGQTGLAHMFERMAFKGTDTIGTRDWPAEKKILEEIEELYDRLEAERNRAPQADASRTGALDAQARMAEDRAQAFVEPDAFSRIMEQNGAVDLRAAAAFDFTEFRSSLPSNRLELWFLMESQRLQRPVFREFYDERSKVLEEYRERVESSPQGRLQQAFLAASFTAHPYGHPPLGWPSDIAGLRAAAARRFFEQRYVPANMVIAIVGDADPAVVRRLAERYFGPMAARPLPPVVETREPPQPGPRVAVVSDSGRPLAMVGYHRPDQYDRDDAVFDVLQLVLSGGRTGLLYKEMVAGKKIALAAQAVATFPAGRYPSLFAFFLAPAPGHTVEENEAAVNHVLARLMTEPMDEAALARSRIQARAGVVRRMASNAGLATLLATFQASYGDWRKLFEALDSLDAVTAADIVRVARKCFVPGNRTMAYIAAPQPGARP